MTKVKLLLRNSRELLNQKHGSTLRGFGMEILHKLIFMLMVLREHRELDQLCLKQLQEKTILEEPL